MYYSFDETMTLDILIELIVRCEQSNVKVRAMVCDMGNTKLLSQLQVYKHNSSFINPFDSSRNVHIFADIPHCEKT